MRRIYKSYRKMLPIIFGLLLFTPGCGAESEPAAVVPELLREAAAQESSEAEEKEALERFTQEEPDDQETLAEEPGGAEEIQEELPLYKRLCGRYSQKIEDEQYETIEIMDFCGNLYALGGEAMAQEKRDLLETYSYYAMEIFPDNPAELLYSSGKEFKAGIAVFSNMSNMGKYWGIPSEGIIRLTDDGLSFEGFGTGLPNGAFTRNEKIEDVFPYRNKNVSPEKDSFEGLWREKNAEAPLYIEFTEDKNLRVYRKEPGIEVLYGCGGYELSGDALSCCMNLLGQGTMPFRLDAVLSLSGNTLTLTPDEESCEDIKVLFNGKPTLELEKAGPDEVPVIALEDNGISFGIETEPFYGVWVTASKDQNFAAVEEKKLSDEGFEAFTLYAPEWEGLTDEPYYCVAAGAVVREAEAEALLERVISKGYTDAYVKYTGRRNVSLTNSYLSQP